MKVQKATDFFSTSAQRNLDHQVKICIDQAKTPENIGSILRIAGNIGLSIVYVIGEETMYRASKIKKASSIAHKSVRLEFINSTKIDEFKKEGFQLIGIETTDSAKNIYKHKFEGKNCFVFGNESIGISNDLLKKCDFCLYIPISGTVKSMNVATACAVSLFEWLRQGID